MFLMCAYVKFESYTLLATYAASSDIIYIYIYLDLYIYTFNLKLLTISSRVLDICSIEQSTIL